MFDPFGDFGEVGYLRNSLRERDLVIVKRIEHELFRAQLGKAISYLAELSDIAYADFLKVHEILFSELYPWAGQDRSVLTPDTAVRKGEVIFCSPMDCRRAVEYALRLGQNPNEMRGRPGQVMGLFAFGHPFLDGNGRAMLVVYSELCFRANFSIRWEDTDKQQYLAALSKEIANPNDGVLDSYLSTYLAPSLERQEWQNTMHELRGLSGVDVVRDTSAPYDQPETRAAYLEFERKRAYRIPSS